jgi:hypothetical protein
MLEGREMKRYLFVATLVLLSLSLTVQATMVSYSGTVSGSSGGTAGKTLLFSIPKFDPSIGTLTDIKVTMDGSQSSTLHVWSIDNSDGTVRAYLPGYISVISDTVTLATQNYVFQNPSYPGYDPTQSWGDYQIAWSTILSPVVKNYGPSDTGFSDFIGATGNAPLSGYAKWNSPSSLSIDGNFGDTSSSWTTPFTFHATVEYTYIPEPATMVLLGLGGLLLRKRK